MKTVPRVEILCIGSELLTGKPNTHADYLSLKLRAIGLPVSRATTLRDDLPDAAREFIRALERSDVVIATGGLGPTFDDLTREAAAQSLGRPLRFVPRLFERIRDRFRRSRLRMPAINRRQAHLIEGAESLDNPNGSAPGQLLKIRRPGKTPRLLFLLPGPHNEMSPMFEDKVLPVLRRLYGRRLAREEMSLHFCGISESALDMALKPVLKNAPGGAEFTILGGPGVSHLHATVTAATRAQARRALARIRILLPASARKHLYAEGPETLESAVGRLLKARRKTLSVAESCTGGLLAARLTDVPGSSEYFLGGLVAYSNAFKERELGVPEGVLRRPGPVSRRCARAMAEGGLRRYGSNYSLAVTGIAGPGGGTPGKPVGLVFLALSVKGGGTRVLRKMFFGSRIHIRLQCVNAALDLLRRSLEIPH